MTREEIIQAISDDKMMPFIQPEQLAGIVDFVIKNYKPSLSSNLDEAAEEYGRKEYSHAIHFWDEGLSKNKPEVMNEGRFCRFFQSRSRVDAVEGYVCPKKGDKYVFRGEVITKCNELKRLLDETE